MSEPLKLCPFCEGKVNIQESDSRMFVHCMKYQCAIGERYDSDAMPDHDFYEKEQAIAAWNTRPTHDALVAALKQARRALNLGLNLAYEKNSSANEGFVVCGCCRERWKIIRHEDNTAGANVQHNPESICGIMQAKMYAIDAALKAAGEL